MFERYVNFEFYETQQNKQLWSVAFERYVNFEFYETYNQAKKLKECLRDM